MKTPLDFASPLAHDTKARGKSHTSVKIVSNLVGKDNPLDTHSIDQFAPTPKEIAGEVVKVERRKIAGAVLHGVGTTVNVGLGVYNWGTDLNKDVNKKGSNVTEKIADSSIDTVKEGEEFVVDTAIADAGFALAAETFEASIVLDLGAAYVNDLVIDHVAAGAKTVVRVAERQEKKAEHSIGKTFKKIGNCNELSSHSYMYPRIAVAGHVFEHSFGGLAVVAKSRQVVCPHTLRVRFCKNRQSRKPDVPGSNPDGSPEIIQKECHRDR